MKKQGTKGATGRAVEKYDNGEVKLKGAYRDGKMHGKWSFCRRDGSLMRAGSFVDGVQVGEWHTYDRNGVVVKTTTFNK